jgi:hypothetical protein
MKMEQENKNKSEDKPTDISIYIAALSANYRPARNPAETTHWFSTEEVVAAIRQLDPSAKISDQQVFTAMRNAGYDFCNRPGSQGLQFKWMLREK